MHKQQYANKIFIQIHWFHIWVLEELLFCLILRLQKQEGREEGKKEEEEKEDEEDEDED